MVLIVKWENSCECFYYLYNFLFFGGKFKIKSCEFAQIKIRQFTILLSKSNILIIEKWISKFGLAYQRV